MTSSGVSQETIVDLHGEPMHADAAVVLKALDRLLTVGAYYSDEHEQYLRAVDEACAVMTGAIAPRDSLALEIAANGMLVLGQVVDPHHRSVRKMYDLLVPLNIARVEFLATLAPSDLRQALAALQEHRRNLGQAGGFREVAIDNLPPTVSIASRRIGQGGGDKVSLDDLLSRWDDVGAPDAGRGEESAHEVLARQFMELAARLVENLESLALSPDAQGLAGQGTLATPEELAALKASLIRLVEVRPDPTELLRLIGHARKALDLCRDPRKVDLAFQILRQEMGVETGRRAAVVKQTLQEDLAFSADMLAAAVADLAAAAEPIAGPAASSRCDQLAFACQLLAGGADEPLLSRVVAAIEAVFAAPDCGLTEVGVAAAAIASWSAADAADVDAVLPPVLAAVRRARPDAAARLWRQVIAERGGELGPNLWPHLVAGLVRGMDPAPQPVMMDLYLKAGAMEVDAALALAPRLSALGAHAAGAPAGDLALLPVERTRALHAVLMNGPAADRHGPQLHRSLARQPLDALTRVLLGALGAYDPAYRQLYFALVREGGRPACSPRLRDMAVAALLDALDALPPERRREAWAPQAVAWLARTAADEAESILARIRNERRWLFLKAWPAACREAAAGPRGEA